MGAASACSHDTLETNANTGPRPWTTRLYSFSIQIKMHRKHAGDRIIVRPPPRKLHALWQMRPCVTLYNKIKGRNAGSCLNLAQGCSTRPSTARVASRLLPIRQFQSDDYLSKKLLPNRHLVDIIQSS
jgi:hypothetical protein